MEHGERIALHRALVALREHSKLVKAWGPFNTWHRDRARVSEEEAAWGTGVKPALDQVPDCLAFGQLKPGGVKVTLWSLAVVSGVPAVLQRVLARTLLTNDVSGAVFEQVASFVQKKQAAGVLSGLVARAQQAFIAASRKARPTLPLRSLAPTGAGLGAPTTGATAAPAARAAGGTAVSPPLSRGQLAADGLCKLVADGNRLLLVSYLSTAARDSRLDAEPGWLDLPCSSGPRESALMMAVRSNKIELVDVLLDAGADPNARGQSCGSGATPLAVALSATGFDGTSMAKALLAMGADPRASVPAGAVGNEAECTPYTLAGDNVSMKYWLRVAMRQPRMGPEQKAFLRRLGLQRLPMIDFSLVGQDAAKTAIKEQLVAFFSNLGAAKGKPLVVLMPGPPGHGKTALVRDGIARVLQGMRGGAEAPFAMVACEQVTDKSNMFGSAAGLSGSNKQGALQAACSRGGEGRDEDLALSGQPAVILLDEIDKCLPDTLRTFYGAFEDGRLRDGSGGAANSIIDCSSHAFMLTCNWAQDVCNDFEPEFQQLAQSCHLADAVYASTAPEDVRCREEVQRKQEAGMQRLLLKLETQVRDRVRQGLRKGRADALVGRMSAVVPFVAFSETERLVVVDTFLREYCALVRKAPEQRFLATLANKDLRSSMYVGNLDLVVDDGVREALAEKYTPGDGMRSIRNAVLAATSVAVLRGIDEETVRLDEDGVVARPHGLQRAMLSVAAIDPHTKVITLQRAARSGGGASPTGP